MDRVTQLQHEKDFLEGWLSDLLETLQAELDEPTLKRLIAGCGRGCFRRHAFKQEIAARGRGSLENLVAAMQGYFETWQTTDGVHIRYGETAERCYCPVLAGQTGAASGLHCECTRATHQAIFEAALGRAVQVEIIETLRRGGRTCHFVAKVVEA